MAKVNVGRQGYLTKSALPTVTRPRPIYSNLLLLGSGSNGQTTFTDSSINNFAINRFGNTVISTATAPTGMTSSILFDGNGDYLTTTPSTAWTLGTQNFTLEAYFFCPSTPTGVQQILGAWDSAGSLSFQIAVFTNNRLVISLTATGTYNPAFEVVTANNTFAINTWNHVAYVRSGDVFSIYVNGLLIDSRTYAALNVFSNPSSFKIGGNTNNQWFNGYLSNVRITIGTALYNGSFTPPTLPMSNSPTPVFALSALLNANQTTDNTSNTNVVDSSTHNLPVSYQAGMPTQTQATPFAAGTGGSFRFDQAGDFLQVSGTNNQLTLGTGDFTIEFWFWTPSTASQIYYDQRTTNTQLVPTIYVNSVGPSIRYFTNGADRITGSNIAVNTWYHVALVRISGNTRLYLNGVQTGSTYADTNNYIGNADRPIIGMDGGGSSPLNNYQGLTGSGAIRGFISNVRVVKGIGVYTGNFTVPTSPLTATQSAGTNIAAISGTETSLLLNGTNYMLVDSSTNNTKGLAAFGPNYGMTGGQVNFHPYSGGGRYGSYWFDGSFSFIDSLDNADWQITGDYTVEAWIYPTSLGVFRRIVSQLQGGSNTNTAWALSINASNNILWEVYQGSSSFTITSSTTISANVWTHIAVSRSGTTQTLYINGVSRGTNSLTGSSNDSTYPLRIGAEATNTIPANTVPGLVSSTTVGGAALVFPGYITGVRIVKGTAVYTGAFTPPSIQPVDVSGAASAASYPSTTNVNTSFASSQTSLLCKFDRWTVQDNDTWPRPVYLLGTAQTSTSQAKFGAASLTGGSSLSNTTLTYLASPYSFGTGDFTIQCWAYTSAWNAPNNENPLWTIGLPNSATNSSNVYSLFINNTGSVIINRYGTGNTTIGTINTATYTNVWFHVAVVRRSGTTTVYIDGTSIGSTAAFSGLTVGNVTGILAGGRYNVGLSGTGTYTMWNGFIDDFNVAAFALYSTNFTPPAVQATDPYPVQPTISNSTYGAYQNY